jgi:outer membrane protein TolC
MNSSIRRLRPLFFLSLTFTSAAVWSAPEVSQIGYEQAVIMAVEGNPDLASIRSQGESLKEKAKQALAPNSPVVSFTKNNLSSLNPSLRGASESMSLAYTLAFPGKSLIQSQGLDSQANSTRERSRDKELEVVTSVSNNFVALYVNKLRLKLYDEQVSQSKNLVGMIEQKYRMAQASQVDLMNSKASLANLEHDVIVEIGERENQFTQFRNLIKRPSDLSIEPKIPEQVNIPSLDRSEEDLERMMLANSAKLKAASHQTQAAESALSNAKMAALPDFQFTAGVNVYYVPTAAPVTDQARDYNLGVGIAIPLFFPLNEMSQIRSAKKDLESMKYQETSNTMNAIANLRALVTQFKALLIQRESLKEHVVPMNKASYELTLKSYSYGKADYLLLKDARQNWYESQRTYYGSILDSAKVYNQILLQVGCDFTGRSTQYVCK